MTESQYTAAHVANFFIDQAEKDNYRLSQMKLQKLVYIGFGWVSALLERDLFDEPIMAWQHGPVITSIYHAFKHYGKHPIQEQATEFDLDQFDISTPKFPETEKDILSILGKVWDVYKNFNAWDLRQKTHEENTPWSKAYNGAQNVEIPKDSIKEHFQYKIGQYFETT